MANINVTTAANFIPELWAANTLDAVEFATVWCKLVNREYDGEIKAYGDTVHIPHISNYTANTKSTTAGTSITFEAMTHNKTDVSIDTHKYAAFQVEKFTAKQVLPGFVEKQTKKLGYAIARAMDVSVAALVQAFADSTVGTLGVELTDNDYNSAWQKLAEAGVVEENSTNNDVVIVLSAAAYAAALRNDRLVNRDYAGDSGADALRRAKLGSILGSDVHMSNLTRSGSAGQHDCAWFHKDAMTICTQMMPEVERDFIIEQLADAVVCHSIYGVAELQRPTEGGGSAWTSAVTDNFGVWMKTV